MSDRIVITGASGFIGRQAVAPLVQSGYEVHLLVRTEQSLSVLDPSIRQACHVHIFDLLDRDTRNRFFADIRPSHLLHFAWHGDPRTRWTSASNIDWAVATLMMAREFAANGGRRMVVCGTCAEYDWHYSVLKEGETPLSPGTLYGAAKANTHKLLAAGAGELGISLAWGHVFFCYGPGEPGGRLLNDVISGLLAKRPVPCTQGNQVRDYLHTEDIGRAFSLLVASDFEGSINVASGTGIRVRDLVTKAADLLGQPELIEFGAKPQAASEPASLIADTTRLNEILKFKARYALEQGLARTIEWFRAQASS